MNRRALIFAATTVVVVAAFVWLAMTRLRPGTGASSFQGRPAGPAGAAVVGRSADKAAVAGGAGDEPSHLADLLNAPTGDIHADLRIVNEIFRQYRSSTRQSDPVGENVEITAALTGRNRIGFAFIPPDSPAINAKGELCDRWGTPFFFHQLSGTQMEIRSAGPDKQMWTADDQVLTPGLAEPRL